MNLSVYKITNIKTGKIYIGSTNNPFRRECEHFFALNEGSHHNYKLQSDFKAYGKNNFTFEIIEAGFKLKRDMLLKEYELILSTWDKNYNISREMPLPAKERTNTVRSTKNGTIISRNKKKRKGKQKDNPVVRVNQRRKSRIDIATAYNVSDERAKYLKRYH